MRRRGFASGVAEFDRVTGGGFVRGSVLLVGGDPGIGKSTLLIQAAAALAQAGHRTVYISGEEAVAQVRLRAERLGLGGPRSNSPPKPRSRTFWPRCRRARSRASLSSIPSRRCGPMRSRSAPGTVTQVRGSAQTLIRFAKRSGTTIILVGHVTKDGQIAGPRVVEHMVDAVLSFEGEGSHQFRILRAMKNRFGPTDEIGVFEMTGAGLREVANPVRAFSLGTRAGQSRHGGIRRDRGHAPAAGRNPGPGGPDRAGHAPPGGGRLGPEPAVPWCSRCWKPIAG